MDALALAPGADIPPRVRHGVFALVAVTSVAAILGMALSPYLLVRHPLLLVILAPEPHHIALAAPSAGVVALVGLAAARKVLGLTASYGLGLLYGEAAVEWSERRFPRFARFVRWLERLFARVGPVLLIIAPMHVLTLLAGASRTRLWAFLVPTVIGQVLWFALTYYLGEAISDVTAPLVALVSRHLLASTLVCVALVATYQVQARLRRARPSKG